MSDSCMSAPKVTCLPRKQQERVWTWIFLDIIFLSLLVSVVCHALYGSLPLYIEAIGGKAAFSGLLTAVFAIAAGVGRIMTGMIVSRYGCRMVLIISAIILTIANLGPLVFPGLGVLLFIRFFQGVGFSGISTGTANAAAEVLPRSRLGEGMGYYGLGQSISTVIGPSLGYFLFGLSQTTSLGTSIIWYSVASISFILIGLAYICRYTRNVSDEKNETCENHEKNVNYEKKEIVKNTESDENIISQSVLTTPSPSIFSRIRDSFYERGAVAMAIVTSLFMFSASFYSSFLMLFAERNGIPNPQLFFLGTAGAMFAVRLFGAKLGDRFPPLSVLIPCFVLGLLSFWLTIVANCTAMLLLVGILYGICIGINFPILNTLAYRMTPSSRWHATTATFFLGCDIGWAIGSYSWGVIIDHFGFSTALFSAGMVIILASGVVFSILRRRNFNQSETA
ncbi:MAG: MFS transporter [Planctomycetia bacterium]|nr:MFS transporter [Planctomycetia bacterium]